MLRSQGFPAAGPIARPLPDAIAKPTPIPFSPDADIVGYYLADADGHVWEDHSDVRKNLTVGGPVKKPGRKASAWYFDGSNDKMSLADFVRQRVNSGNTWEVAAGTLFEQFDTVGDWTAGGAGTTVTADTTHFKEAPCSMMLSCAANINGSMTKTINRDMSADTTVAIDIYIPDKSLISTIGLYFASQADFSKQAYIALASFKDDGWNHFVIPTADFTLAGGELWANPMIRLRVMLKPIATDATSISVDNLYLNRTGKSVVIITHDGNYESIDLIAEPILTANSQKATRFIHDETVGGAGKSTLAALLAEKALGWDISNHTTGHTDLTSVTGAALNQAVEHDYNYLVANGFNKGLPVFCWPYGNYNAASLAVVAMFHKIARNSTTGTYHRHQVLDGDGSELLFKANTVTDATAAATVTGWIDKVISLGNVLPLVFHDIVAAGPAAENQWIQADYQTVSDYIAAAVTAGTLLCKTFSEYYAKISQPVKGSTICFWVNITSTGNWERILAKEDTRDTLSIMLDTSQKMRYQCKREATSSDCSSNAAVTTGSWQHYALVWTGAALNMYRNGVLQTSKPAFLGNIIDPTDTLYLGSSEGTGSYGNFYMDELLIIRRALSSAEINKIYQRGLN